MVDVLIRVDASTKIGTGHVMRCLTIAEELRQRDCSISFYMKNSNKEMKDFVSGKGFHVVNFFQPTDLFIIDHYDIDEKWEREIRPHVRKIVVIDDLANRRHDCDVLLDQNLVHNFARRYDELVPATCKKLLGLRYFIARDEFIQERESVKPRSGKVERLLVFMGGTDPTNESMKLLRAFHHVPMLFSHVDVVVGDGNKQKGEIEQLCKEHDLQFHCQIDYMASLVSEADVAIGAGGTAMWERCYLGLPTATVIVADNQKQSVLEAEQHGLIWNLGEHDTVTTGDYASVLTKLVEKQDEVQRMSQLCLQQTSSERLNEWVDYFLEGLS
ncbi:MAG TPA: UDP-2,4-diacetamido-2,4,6-trideoxy-beta-L-altropyranose hydrolase [Pseudogracilibacillus sp.]|nr:UDP-2,4-diacetamido-2,4,6-trideoxy-beta-L-altropyranose hydrolase [Pseudogracilibacillus sp.]